LFEGKRQIVIKSQFPWGHISPLSSRIRGGARIVLVATVPWAPAYLFERAAFYAHTYHSPLYGLLSGTRLEIDAASFAFGGILLAFLLRPRLALAQVLTSTVIVWALFYRVCETFRSADGLLHSACYHPGPDGLAGYRLALMMFSFGALPVLVRASSHSGLSNKKLRPMVAVFAGIVVSVVTGWFPLTAWFSGASYVPLFLPIHAAVLLGLPEIACGIMASRISGSVRIAIISGMAAGLFMAGSMWTLSCPGCDRSLVVLLIPLWGLFSGLGGFLELGNKTFAKRFPKFDLSLPSIRKVVLAGVIIVSLWTLIAYPFWAPSVLYAAVLSPDPDPLHLGLPIYRPYVAGYYKSIQYRICCLEVGVSFVRADPQLMGPGNFLMAGMGVQSPNCCIDGWDFGWRADVFLLPNGTFVVSGSSWETCDANANCGGHFWQHLRYHVTRIITPPQASSMIFLRMMWEAGVVNWYYNYTELPWQKFGSFAPDWREGIYFDIGVIGPGGGNDPYRDTYFFQFGVASKTPFPGWEVLLKDPSFQFEGAWRVMEKAAVIQGDFSYWKVAYRWGGAPYPGVEARANALDPSFPPNSVEFVHTGGHLDTNTPLW